MWLARRLDALVGRTFLIKLREPKEVSHAVFTIANVDKNEDLASHYGISSVPALLIFKDGKIAAKHVGMTTESTLRAELQALSN